MQLSGVRTAGTTPASPLDEGSGGSTPAARTVTYPRVDEDSLARQIFERKYERTPGKWTRYATGVGIGAGTFGAAGAGVGLLVARHAASSGATVSMARAAMKYGLIGAGVGAAAGIGLGMFLNRMTPARARDYAAQSLDMNAKSRPALPLASQVPTERVGVPGEVRSGLSGSTIGGIVQLKQAVLGDITTRTTTTHNTRGEPTIVIGSKSGSQVTTEAVTRTEDVKINSIGLGRVLYDRGGYDSMAAAMRAYDGKHAAAIVKDGERYLIVDADAENWSALGAGSSSAISIADERVKAIFANQGVYYPTSIGAGKDDGPQLFLFAQGQDIDKTVPPDVNELKGQAIGTYETNEVPAFNDFASRYELKIGDAVGSDQYSGFGFSGRDDAVSYMSSTPGNQALVRSGSRYYVTNLHAVNGRGDGTDMSSMIDNTPEGSAVLGLRTNDASSKVQLIEDEGGLYAPVQDWWVRVNTTTE